jgi:hypothetical protein
MENLEEMLPQSIQIDIGQKKSVNIRMVTLSDIAYFHNDLGEERLEKIMSGHDIAGLARALYRLMSNEDKRKFLSEEHTFINDDGDEVTEKISGPDKFMRSVQGIKGMNSLLLGLAQAYGVDSKFVEETGDKVNENLKKNRIRGQ